MMLNEELNKILNAQNISGLADELKTQFILKKHLEGTGDSLVLTNSLYEATSIFNELKAYNNDVFLFPMDEYLTSVALAVSPELKVKRLETLNEINSQKKKMIVTNIMGFLKYVPNKETIKKLNVKLKKDETIKRENLEKLIFEFGYTKSSIVTSTGEYSLRGYIIDIFPYNFNNPVRIELFGNQIERIREFDAETQLSKNDIDSIEILPYQEIKSNNNISIIDLLNDPILIKVDSELIDQGIKQLETQMMEYQEQNPEYKAELFHYDDIKTVKTCNIFSFNKPNVLNIQSENIENFSGNYELLKKYLEKNLQQKKQIRIVVKNKSLYEFLKETLSKYVDSNLTIEMGSLNHGFIYGNFIYLSENDIEKNSNISKYTNPIKIGRKIKDFNDIKVGDYVVHAVHGIGIYGGIITLEKSGIKKDYILINYAGNDKVYIPVEKITSVYKYSDAEGTVPKINKLNSVNWQKTKNSIRKKLNDISEQLVKLYAERSLLKSPKYQTFPEEIVFASNFAYEATKDQIKCSEDILNDLKKDIPMDRLLCGDVGFGKTEVAFRAIFNTVMNGYQVAYLCPTTILAKQQYESALSRFKEYPINIRLINRFTTPKNFKNTCEDLANGKIDIIFGTHKLFNSKVEYKNLGLLIIDEEQRFGVAQKEKLKELKKNVNILTLSATPIPRTLKMAMSGIKDLSILDTAPQYRDPVQTYVVEENDLLIKDAIYKELSRKGQVFYLYNNVKNIESETQKIKKLVPEARVCYAHGQLTKHESESIIESFINNEYDVLVCTTIIETGIDIPNVNTLIISNAQNYGLSQLYQLRGRVGRSNKIAYAYLTYNKGKTLTETAIKRLKSIKEFTELGSGYKIAMRDLSIRGAGDILGGEQAGFIDSVGIDLYTKMLEEAIRNIKGLPSEEEPDDKPSLINVNTHIKTNYVEEESVRIEIHKLINTIENKKTLEQVKNELEDRFGKIDEDLEIYMYEEWFEKLAEKLKIKQVTENHNHIEIYIPEEFSSKINGEKLFLKMYNINPKFKIRYFSKRIIISLPTTNLEKHYIYYLTELLQEIINDIS